MKFFIQPFFFFVIPVARHSAYTIPTWPLSGGEGGTLDTSQAGYGGNGLQTYQLQGCVRSYAIVCSLPGFDTPILSASNLPFKIFLTFLSTPILLELCETTKTLSNPATDLLNRVCSCSCQTGATKIGGCYAYVAMGGGIPPPSTHFLFSKVRTFWDPYLLCSPPPSPQPHGHVCCYVSSKSK